MSFLSTFLIYFLVEILSFKFQLVHLVKKELTNDLLYK